MLTARELGNPKDSISTIHVGSDPHETLNSLLTIARPVGILTLEQRPVSILALALEVIRMDKPMRLRDLRRARRWTQRDLARELGVSASAVANWEVGLRVPSLQMAKRIAALFGVRVEDIEFIRAGHSSRATKTA